jgi:endonuclease YncB( thermonuclease family)
MSTRSLLLFVFCPALLVVLAPVAQTQSSSPTVKRERLPGPLLFPNEPFLRISGKVTVLDAHTLRYADGTEIDMNGAINAPELNQKSLVNGTFSPCGREAADFLRKLIGDGDVTCLTAHSEKSIKPGARFRAFCFVNEVNLQIEMVRNGWAISHHSSMEPWEAIARQNTRGLWRGQFVVPEKWSKGERLPGE